MLKQNTFQIESEKNSPRVTDINNINKKLEENDEKIDLFKF